MRSGEAASTLGQRLQRLQPLQPLQPLQSRHQAQLSLLGLTSNSRLAQT